jgi:hypothetical protein
MDVPYMINYLNMGIRKVLGSYYSAIQDVYIVVFTVLGMV